MVLFICNFLNLFAAYYNLHSQAVSRQLRSNYEYPLCCITIVDWVSFVNVFKLISMQYFGIVTSVPPVDGKFQQFWQIQTYTIVITCLIRWVLGGKQMNVVWKHGICQLLVKSFK